MLRAMTDHPTHRYAAGIEYDGTRFLGWQTQDQTPTVQATVEAAMSFVANEPIVLTCAGRTDTGVHALGQVAHFESSAIRSERSWVLGSNTRLPDDVAVKWVRQVPMDFHARYSAIDRRYRYRIVRSTHRPVLDRHQSMWAYFDLDVARMDEAARALIGEHDFTSYRTVACQSPTPMRLVKHIGFSASSGIIDIEFIANAFLHHMIRNIVGSLLLVGRGERPVEWIGEVLAARNRKLAGPTASPQGLVFLGPRYPAHFPLPSEHIA